MKFHLHCWEYITIYSYRIDFVMGLYWLYDAILTIIVYINGLPIVGFFRFENRPTIEAIIIKLLSLLIMTIMIISRNSLATFSLRKFLFSILILENLKIFLKIPDWQMPLKNFSENFYQILKNFNKGMVSTCLESFEKVRNFESRSGSL